MKITPFGSYVITRKKEAEEKITAGGIIVPLIDKSETPVYHVEKTGHACTEVAPMTNVIARPAVGTEIHLSGETFYCFREQTDLIAKIEEDEPKSH